MRKKILIPIILFSLCFHGCSSFLDVVPEGVSRLEHAFAMRKEAEKFLFTCYSYVPGNGDIGSDASLWGGELWTLENVSNSLPFGNAGFDISRGYQNARSPLLCLWGHYYSALRSCNIFLENIGTVPDLPEEERDRWIAEVKVLKAYYHFLLVRQYGAIVIVRENLPIDVSPEQVRVERAPVDDAFAYIVQLLDEAKDVLPPVILNEKDEFGRITAAFAYAFKAKVLVTAASPLYNGNTDQVSLRNKNSNVPLFNQEFSIKKWEDAQLACEEALTVCLKAGLRLYEYPGNFQYDLSDTITTQLSLRCAFTERWTNELIWCNTRSVPTQIQKHTTPKLDIRYQNGSGINQCITTPLAIAEQFYSNHGIPVEEDKTRVYSERYALSKADTIDQLYIRRGATTIRMHFNREPRFYAWIGFDTGVWYGQSHFDDSKPDELFYVQGRKNQLHGFTGPDYGPITGYMPKKYVNYKNVQSEGDDNYSITTYPWPIMRLAELYLLYAEALNEAQNTQANRDIAIDNLDVVRKRAGLDGVKESWKNYSKNAGKYLGQVGMRDIIRTERKIELCFEGQRFWDIRRWKTAMDEARPIQGWDIYQKEPQNYYRKKTVAGQTFGLKDYFWPISEYDRTINPNLVQNVGW